MCCKYFVCMQLNYISYGAQYNGGCMATSTISIFSFDTTYILWTATRPNEWIEWMYARIQIALLGRWSNGKKSFNKIKHSKDDTYIHTQYTWHSRHLQDVWQIGIFGCYREQMKYAIKYVWTCVQPLKQFQLTRKKWNEMK